MSELITLAGMVALILVVNAAIVLTAPPPVAPPPLDREHGDGTQIETRWG